MPGKQNASKYSIKLLFDVSDFVAVNHDSRLNARAYNDYPARKCP